MPTKDRFNARSYFGFTGQPLALPAENVPMPQQMRDRFERQGQSAFVPYIDPMATLARGQQYQRDNHALEIGDAENEFMDNLDGISASPSGLSDFLQKHPAAALSPMVRTWQKMQQPIHRDPYEAKVASEGSDYLHAYRAAVAGGQHPMDAYSEFRDVVKKQKEAAKASKDDELFFVEKGGELDDFAPLKEKGAGRAEMLDFIHKKGKAPTTTEVSKHTKLRGELDAAEKSVDSIEDKEAYRDAVALALGKEASSSPSWTEKDWNDGYFKLKEQKTKGAREALEAFEAGLEEQGKRVPGRKTPTTETVPTAAVIPTQVVPRGTPVAAPIIPAIIPPPAVKPKPGLSPLSQVRQALKP